MTSPPISAPLRRRFAVAMLGLLLLAAWLKLWRLDGLPPAFWYDEAFNALDALSIRDGAWGRVFAPGNSGRGTFFHHLVAVATALFGVWPYTVRLVGVFFGLAAIALMYRWLLTLFAARADRYWLALLGAVGFAGSYWHFTLTRTGYRGSIIPFFFLLIAWLFWLGWQKKSRWYFVGAGVVLGFSQYVYQPARLFPLIFGGFVIIWSLLTLRQLLQAHTPQPSLKAGWLGLSVMAAASVIPFLPLGWYFVQNPSALFGHTNSISVFGLVSAGETTYLRHLLEALTVFTSGSAMHWQRNIVGTPAIDWLTQVSFWLGLGLALWRIRQPAYLFLLISLVITWLPGPLGVPAVDSLHISGMYPPYYALVAVGLFDSLRWLAQRSPMASLRQQIRVEVGVVAVVLLLTISGGISLYKYFGVWANRPEVYYAYEGPVFDVVERLKQEAATHEVIIPQDLYTFPTARFQLYDSFPERQTPPPSGPDSNKKPLLFVTGPDGTLPDPLTPYFWLHQAPNGERSTYALAPNQLASLFAEYQQSGTSEPFLDPYSGDSIALLHTLPATTQPNLSPQLPGQPPLDRMAYRLGEQARLVGYHIEPAWLTDDSPATLTLFWQLLTDQPANRSIFIHVLNPAGEMVAQFDRDFTQDWERWRKDKLLITYHPLTLPANLPDGPYALRVGLFDVFGSQRDPIFNEETGQNSGDSVRLGLFQMRRSSPPQTTPNTALNLNFGSHITLTGYSLHTATPQMIDLSLYWQGDGFISTDYTLFVQLLDGQNQLIATSDSQPLGGLYPTSLWHPGDPLITPASLTLPAELPPGPYRLIAGLYDLNTGQRLPLSSGGDFVELETWSEW